MVRGEVGIQLIVTKINLGTDGSDPTSIGINDTTANSNAHGKTKLVGSLATEGAYELTSTKVSAVLLLCNFFLLITYFYYYIIIKIKLYYFHNKVAFYYL